MVGPFGYEGQGVKHFWPRQLLDTQEFQPPVIWAGLRGHQETAAFAFAVAKDQKMEVFVVDKAVTLDMHPQGGMV